MYQWASRLLPCPGYYKQCCDEHWGTHVSFNSGFLSVYAQEWDCWVIWQFYFQVFKESLHCSHSGCTRGLSFYSWILEGTSHHFCSVPSNLHSWRKNFIRAWILVAGTIESLFKGCLSQHLEKMNTVDSQTWICTRTHLYADFSICIVAALFILRIFKLTKCGGNSFLNTATIWGIRMTRVWVPIQSKLFQLPGFGWIIDPFLCYWGRYSSIQIFHSVGVLAPNPCIVQGSAV